MNDEQFIEKFLDNYNRIFNYTGGHDLQLMLSLACKYTLAKRQFSGVALEKVLEQIQSNGEKALPVQLESKTSYKLAYHLLGQEDMNKEVQRIIANDATLGTVKFKKSAHRIIGALFLQQNDLEHAQRARSLFDEMNRNQRILTTKEDLPYVVFLTRNPNEQPKNQADTIMLYYSTLRKNHLTMGNHLQALAQILTLYSSNYNKLLLEYVVKLREELIERGVKVKKLHYPYLGVLALAATDESKMDDIISLYNHLMKEKIFRNAKDYTLIVAIQKVVQDVLKVQDLIDITSLTNIVGLFDLVEFVFDIGPFFPSGISDVFDFFN
ncbi:DUF4003 family protein [Ureibacillus aquaedulcis]|uniref:DUF4003 family protein n=1 Tax=Ureibacillus aquaedulcis TaxID=3058421 RepID=A0ABT8GRL8_9BACL|nr:DUF4003 family protein [Ureibacillus sp. BA0131]MDN4494060.1 DUF4003 family protein [Ureibacillus sp. BA0131]